MSEKRSLSRREFLKAGALSLGSLLLSGALEGCTRRTEKEVLSSPAGLSAPVPAATIPTTRPGDGGKAASASLRSLIEGNWRFTRGESISPHWDSARRYALSTVQNPVAVVLSCSDARVPPEILFDQGLGDLYVIRTAGNIAGPAGLAGLEYALEELGVPLVVVLGHQDCGAVAAAVQAGNPPGKVAAIVEQIRPAVDTVRAQTGELLPNSVDANIAAEVERLKSENALLAEYLALGSVEVVGARYDLHSGMVDWLTGSDRMMALVPQTEAPEEPPVVQPNQPAPTTTAPPPAGPTQTAAEPPAPAASENFLGTHTVQRGETLYAIGLAYGVNPWAIARVNRLENANLIFPGQRLGVPDIRWRKMPSGKAAKRQF